MRRLTCIQLGSPSQGWDQHNISTAIHNVLYSGLALTLEQPFELSILASGLTVSKFEIPGVPPESCPEDETLIGSSMHRSAYTRTNASKTTRNALSSSSRAHKTVRPTRARHRTICTTHISRLDDTRVSC